MFDLQYWPSSAWLVKIVWDGENAILKMLGDSFYHQVNVGNLVVLKGFELGFFSVSLNIYYVFIENIMGLNEPLTQNIHFALVAESVWKLPVLDYNLLGDGN